MNREYNEHYSFFQVSDRPLGLMETRHLNGLCVRRLGRRLGLVANLGYRRADNNLSGPRRLKAKTLQMQTPQERQMQSRITC
jgi:hypothetical protein